MAVCKNLNTPTKAAFFKVLESLEAQRLMQYREFCSTSKNGSWLNIPENELIAMKCQCLRRRAIGS